MRCPIDDTPMQTMRANDRTVDVCPSCHGIWFDAPEFRRFTHALVYEGDNKKFTDWQHRMSIDSNDQNFWEEDDRLCPRHYQAMQKHHYAGDSAVHIDRCATCKGVWLDGHEVTKLVDYIKPKPVEEALGRFIIQEHQELERLKKDIELLPLTLTQIFQSPGHLVAFISLGLIKLLFDDLLYGEET